MFQIAMYAHSMRFQRIWNICAFLVLKGNQSAVIRFVVQLLKSEKTVNSKPRLTVPLILTN